MSGRDKVRTSCNCLGGRTGSPIPLPEGVRFLPHGVPIMEAEQASLPGTCTMAWVYPMTLSTVLESSTMIRIAPETPSVHTNQAGRDVVIMILIGIGHYGLADPTCCILPSEDAVEHLPNRIRGGYTKSRHFHTYRKGIMRHLNDLRGVSVFGHTSCGRERLHNLRSQIDEP